MWCNTPTCAMCGRLTEWPNGFELDHKIRLDKGGSDTEANCQVLCVYYELGTKLGCHATKTGVGG
jgi:5-methylcytosine-specific restriction protein A